MGIKPLSISSGISLMPQGLITFDTLGKGGGHDESDCLPPESA
jgi:hypothetical protein